MAEFKLDEHIDEIENETMNKLKDFQKKTVERIDYLFRKGQNRILVADEVGMGKTLIARGVIVKTARLRKEENDNLFRVAYVCSNASIVGQNVRRLDVIGSSNSDSISGTRLSMLHLKLALEEHDEDLHNRFIQLIPLTPGTSFQMTRSGGTVGERALMFAILHRVLGEKYETDLKDFLVYRGGQKSWKKETAWYETQLGLFKEKPNKYPDSVIKEIKNSKYKDTPIIDLLKNHITKRKIGEEEYRDIEVLNILRTIFARIGADMLKPDLVIMDEFQRYSSLLKEEKEGEETDIGIISKKFLGGNETRTLLLSATPYKLYSTLEEIDKTHVDEHYREFMQVMDFLFGGKSSNDRENFHEIWSNYSASLKELNLGESTIIQIKEQAENAMYQGVCRTERISVMGSKDYIDDSSINNYLSVTKADIESYLAISNLLKNIGERYSINMEYVKSCPYLLSFMHHYKEKKNIEEYFKKNPDKITLVKNKFLWVNENKINNYDKIELNNARLECLNKIAFENNAEMYLWIPPSKPYYKLQGVYKDSDFFSKILVFSAWEMVPRMIGFMISYEAERRLVEKIRNKLKNVVKKGLRYNAKKRYPSQRLQFALRNGEPQSMNLFALIYPSKTLADIYNPIECINKDMSLIDIQNQVREKLKEKLKPLEKYQTSEVVDNKWYYIAPIKMDGEDYAKSWLEDFENSIKNDIKNQDTKDDTNEEKGIKGILTHIEKLKEYINMGEDLKLGKMPSDLLSTLVNMVLGSFAVCIYRTIYEKPYLSTLLSRVFVSYFNSTEATAIVELAANKDKTADDNTHWQDVLLYCKNGCFQSMFDEYYHLISEGIGVKDNKNEKITEVMSNDLLLRNSVCLVNSYGSFEENKKAEKRRSHYAVGFFDDSESDKEVDRKNSIRGAFNSPLRPFVLASTSIGQEGLDFHNYCRKIMHWNLPSNPVDLEQREGRINRFKCLSIRQSVAKEYGNCQFTKDIWTEMFENAKNDKKEDQSDLIPYWCLGEKQKVQIERIVPMYPVSKDILSYNRLIKILSLYRLTLGQARQEELLEYVFKECDDTEKLKNLFINLSPFSKKTED